MAITIQNAYVQSFEENARYLAQQKVSKLRGKVMEKSVTSEKHNWERIGTLDAALKSSARVATPEQDAAWSRRVSLASTYHIGTTTEQEDIVQMLIDPNSTLTRAVAMGMNRQVDDIIIAAATGTALDGDGNNVAFPAGQQLGDGLSAITFGAITEIQEKFMDNEIDPDVPKCAVVSPAQVKVLMQLTEQTSADYVHREALQKLSSTGIVPNWMGFTWIVSTRLLSPSASAHNCLFFTEQAIGLQNNKDITARVAEDPSISFAWRIYSHLTMGAVRVEDEHIVAYDFLD